MATKYVQLARRHFADKGVHVDLIKLYGSMELAPLTPGRGRQRLPQHRIGERDRLVDQLGIIGVRLVVLRRGNERGGHHHHATPAV